MEKRVFIPSSFDTRGSSPRVGVLSINDVRIEGGGVSKCPKFADKQYRFCGQRGEGASPIWKPLTRGSINPSFERRRTPTVGRSLCLESLIWLGLGSGGGERRRGGGRSFFIAEKHCSILRRVAFCRFQHSWELRNMN